LAASIERLNASAELMSGFGAPARTATDASTGDDDTSAGKHLSLLDEIIDHVWVVGDHVRGRIGIDLVHQSRPDLEADDDLVPAHAFDRGARSRTADTTRWLARTVISVAWTVSGLNRPSIKTMTEIAAFGAVLTTSSRW
jgi:hypothetical protein